MRRRRRWVEGDPLGDGLHPPTGVEVRDEGGAWHPVQTVYDHTDAQGLQVYDVVDLPPEAVVVNVRVATLPGMTAIRVPTSGAP